MSASTIFVTHSPPFHNPAPAPTMITISPSPSTSTPHQTVAPAVTVTSPIKTAAQAWGSDGTTPTVLV